VKDGMERTSSGVADLFTSPCHDLFSSEVA
jgi:hypothetical protein